MKTKWKTASASLLLIGVFLIVSGGWGLFSDQVFGAIGTNRWRAVIELAVGIGAFVAVLKDRPLGYLTTLGGVFVATVVLWALPFSKAFFEGLLAMNDAAAVAYFLIGLVCFLTGSASGTRVDVAGEGAGPRRRTSRTRAAH